MKEIDWSKAPVDATHYNQFARTWIKHLGSGIYQFLQGDEWSMGFGCMDSRYIERPKPEPWSGEGLPPVGTVCEYQRNDVSYRQEWVKVTTKYFGKEMVVLEHSASGEEYVEQAASCVFRPTRTPEQIAAEELKAAIDEMSEVTQGAHDWLQAFQKLHLAGYRKVTP